ncbi:hypothetical protein [Agromyces larvae]|nr:hypothetical protein [Agromyces larvae]
MSDSLGSGQVVSDPDKPIIHFGSPIQDLIPFAIAQIEKETP